MSFSRRQHLLQLLLGAGKLGLRSMATGLPIQLLRAPEVFAKTCSVDTATGGKFLILNTSQAGDPVNANVPGTYLDSRIVHPPQPQMAPTTLRLSGKSFTAAAPWATLPQKILDQTVFFHHTTLTNVHSQLGKVLRMQGATLRQEMTCSIFAKALARCLGTIQVEPMSVGARGPGETLSFEGRSLANIQPTVLQDLLLTPASPLSKLQALRDQHVDELNAVFKEHGNAAQKSYLDRYALSQRQARSLSEELLSMLAGIKEDGPMGQLLAAITLVKMKVSPVISVHIPFGGDNHTDTDLKQEANESVQGVAAFNKLWEHAETYQVASQLVFASLNVFGRTLSSNGLRGRHHSNKLHCTVLMGAPFKGGVVGGVEPSGDDFQAQAIESATGAGVSAASAGAADIQYSQTLGSMMWTLGKALALSDSYLKENLFIGKPVVGALQKV